MQADIIASLSIDCPGLIVEAPDSGTPACLLSHDIN